MAEINFLGKSMKTSAPHVLCLVHFSEDSFMTFRPDQMGFAIKLILKNGALLELTTGLLTISK